MMMEEKELPFTVLCRVVQVSSVEILLKHICHILLWEGRIAFEAKHNIENRLKFPIGVTRESSISCADENITVLSTEK